MTCERPSPSRLSVEVTYALFPQAKGKVEHPYRWLQDRIVRTCALEHLSTVEEVQRYNSQQVHSTTGQMPHLRFEQARTSGNNLFRPFAWFACERFVYFPENPVTLATEKALYQALHLVTT